MFPPFAVATLALVMINLLPRRDLAEAGESLDEGGEVRTGTRPLSMGSSGSSSGGNSSSKNPALTQLH